MNRETFIHNITNVNDDNVLTIFDKLMALYNLQQCTNACDNVKISNTSSDPASFDLCFDDTSLAINFFNIANGLQIRMYEIPYLILCELDNNIVHLSITNKPVRV